MFRGRKYRFASAVNLIQDSIIFSGFAVLVHFCFVTLPIFWLKIRVCSFRSIHAAGSQKESAAV